MEPYATPSPVPAPYSGGPVAYDDRLQSPTVSVGDWLVTYLLTSIPVVGFIMLFVWAFSSSTPPSKANWAKAALVVMVIFMVLGFLFASSLLAFVASMSGSHRAY